LGGDLELLLTVEFRICIEEGLGEVWEAFFQWKLVPSCRDMSKNDLFAYVVVERAKWFQNSGRGLQIGVGCCSIQGQVMTIFLLPSFHFWGRQKMMKIAPLNWYFGRVERL